MGCGSGLAVSIAMSESSGDGSRHRRSARPRYLPCHGALRRRRRSSTRRMRHAARRDLAEVLAEGEGAGSRRRSETESGRVLTGTIVGPPPPRGGAGKSVPQGATSSGTYGSNGSHVLKSGERSSRLPPPASRLRAVDPVAGVEGEPAPWIRRYPGVADVGAVIGPHAVVVGAPRGGVRRSTYRQKEPEPQPEMLEKLP